MRTLLMAFVLLGLFSSYSFAADPSSKESPKALTRQKGKMFEKELNLSAEQIEKVKAIRQKYRPQFRGKSKEVEAAYKDLADGMKLPKKGTEYQAVLTEKYTKLQNLKEEVQQVKFKMALEIRELLSDDQIAKYASMRKGHEE